MKRFLNSEPDLVHDALDGLVAASGGTLARLDGYPSTKVVLRADWKADRVAVISGGGAGHEPAHAGFVGRGMLTAAVSGDVFASPGTSSVLAAIEAVTGEAGCLLIVKSYTGDRLNFGLAAERAKARGKKVEMVVVEDDIAIEDAPHPRGIAGTVLVHKIAGHLAESGASLEEVARAARAAAESTVSLGLALETCHVPGAPEEEGIPADRAELGLGIHGEPGFERIPMDSRDALLGRVLERLEDKVGDGPLVAMVNGLGAVPPIELLALAAGLGRSKLAERIELMVGPSGLMTSLDMNGFSVSLLPLDDTRRTALGSDCAPSAWPGARNYGAPELVKMPSSLETAPPAASKDPEVRALLETVCGTLEAAAAELDALDNAVGDGDTGQTLKTGADAISKRLDALPLADGAALLARCGELLSDHVGGSMGALLAIMLSSGAKHFEAGAWASALRHGLEAMKRYGGAERGQSTLIDALEPALGVLAEGGSLADAAKAARAGADETAKMSTAGAGRASYLNADSLSGNVDPGAEAVARVFEALA